MSFEKCPNCHKLKNPFKTNGIFNSSQKALRDLVTKNFDQFETEDELIVFVITLSMILHKVLHNLHDKKILEIKSLPLKDESQEVNNYVGNLPVLGYLNYHLNYVIKKKGIYVQPAVAIALAKLIRNIGSKDTKFRTIMLDLKDVAEPIAYTKIGRMIYEGLFEDDEPDLGLFYNPNFDPSGHAMLTQSHIFNVYRLRKKMKKENTDFGRLEKAIWRAYVAGFIVTALTTIIFYHTVPEYITGLLLGLAVEGGYSFMISRNFSEDFQKILQPSLKILSRFSLKAGDII